LAQELTTMIHSQADYDAAVETSNVLFNGSLEDLNLLNEETFLDIFEGLPQFVLSPADLENNINLLDLLAEKTTIFPSKSEAKKMILGGGISINKEKINSPDHVINLSHLINSKYIIVQKGKKNYYLCRI
jgi:tyrosyl-tRNA synthetase